VLSLPRSLSTVFRRDAWSKQEGVPRRLLDSVVFWATESAIGCAARLTRTATFGGQAVTTSSHFTLGFIGDTRSDAARQPSIFSSLVRQDHY
jgi:hypothetical protein